MDANRISNLRPRIFLLVLESSTSKGTFEEIRCPQNITRVNNSLVTGEWWQWWQRSTMLVGGLLKCLLVQRMILNIIKPGFVSLFIFPTLSPL